MFKLKTGYLISGIITGFMLIVSYFSTMPDGKLHIVYCDVGQGDASYLRLPDSRDIIIDGGPNDKNLLSCLSENMPFWDHTIDLMILSHPQKDHLQGLISVLEKYEVGTFIQSDVYADSEAYKNLVQILIDKKVEVRFLTSGSNIQIGRVNLSLLWPSVDQINRGPKASLLTNLQSSKTNVMGAQNQKPVELNDFCLVLLLTYGEFDALFPGDADNHINRNFIGSFIGNDIVELLKVPHHGSKTGLTQSYLKWLNPDAAIISVGKNSYGHPSQEIINLLNEENISIYRTDQDGNIEVVTDGINWKITKKKDIVD